MDDVQSALICEINFQFDEERERVDRLYRSCRIAKWERDMSLDAIADQEEREIEIILERV